MPHVRTLVSLSDIQLPCAQAVSVTTLVPSQAGTPSIHTRHHTVVVRVSINWNPESVRMGCSVPCGGVGLLLSEAASSNFQKGGEREGKKKTPSSVPLQSFGPQENHFPTSLCGLAAASFQTLPCVDQYVGFIHLLCLLCITSSESFMMHVSIIWKAEPATLRWQCESVPIQTAKVLPPHQSIFMFEEDRLRLN